MLGQAASTSSLGPPHPFTHNILRLSIGALDMLHHQFSQRGELCRAICGTLLGRFEVHRSLGQSVYGGIDVAEARARFSHTVLPGSDPAAQGKADTDATVLVQHFICSREKKFRALDALPSSRQFQF
jgi:hypothetical protein